MKNQLSEYQVTFSRDPVFGFWSWSAKAPNSETLKGPLLGSCIAKKNAESDAARRIELHAGKETVNGQALVDRLSAMT